MPDHAPLTMVEVNALELDDFVERFGGIFEHAPWIATEAWSTSPWPDLAALHAAMFEVVETAPQAAQLVLIRSHPDLVGEAALAGTLTRESSAEQQAAGLDRDGLTADEITHFTEANSDYQERFGFPFIICAREKRKEAILASFDRRLRNDQRDEIETAVEEIGCIAWYRLADLVETDPS